MDSNGHQRGIKLLLAAEQEAQQIVNDARRATMARLKQAHEETGKEVAEYRAQMDLEFQRKITERCGVSGANAERLEQETGAKIDHFKIEAGKMSLDVSQMLLEHVTTVKV